MSARPPAVPFRDACRYWATLGFIDFGGPTGQIAFTALQRRHLGMPAVIAGAAVLGAIVRLNGI